MGWFKSVVTLLLPQIKLTGRTCAAVHLPDAKGMLFWAVDRLGTAGRNRAHFVLGRTENG